MPERLWLPTVVLMLAGCAPLGDFRPASGFLPDHYTEVGAGVMAIGKRPYVDEPTRAAGQLWASRLLGERVSISGVAAFDDEAAAFGGALRFDYLRTDRVGLGAEAQAGFAWAGVSLPGAVRLFDQTWLYAAPRFLPRFREWMLDIPVGVNARIYHGFMLRLEYHVTWVELDYYSKRNELGLGAAYQF